MSDQQTRGFLATTIIGGLLFLVPVVFLAYIVGKAFSIMLMIAIPIAELLPFGMAGGVALVNLLAALGIVGVCFLAGLLARYSLASGFVKNMETKVLANIPGYAMIKGIKSGFDVDEADSMKVVLVKLDCAERIGLETEQLIDGRSMIFLPGAPNPWSGVTQIVPAEQITYLDVSITEAMKLSESFGHGVDAILQHKDKKEAAANRQ